MYNTIDHEVMVRLTKVARTTRPLPAPGLTRYSRGNIVERNRGLVGPSTCWQGQDELPALSSYTASGKHDISQEATWRNQGLFIGGKHNLMNNCVKLHRKVDDVNEVLGNAPRSLPQMLAFVRNLGVYGCFVPSSYSPQPSLNCGWGCTSK